MQHPQNIAEEQWDSNTCHPPIAALSLTVVAPLAVSAVVVPAQDDPTWPAPPSDRPTRQQQAHDVGISGCRTMQPLNKVVGGVAMEHTTDLLQMMPGTVQRARPTWSTAQ
jgi:hypothetical protein